jgi:prevent-host-death family protein
MMVRRSLAEAKAHLSELVDQAEHKKRRILILRHGKPVAALVAVEVVMARQGRGKPATDEEVKAFFEEAETIGRMPRLVARKEATATEASSTYLTSGSAGGRPRPRMPRLRTSRASKRRCHLDRKDRGYNGFTPQQVERFSGAFLSRADVATIGPRSAKRVQRVVFTTRLRAADAIYAWLAAREGVPLVTLDAEMGQRAASVGHHPVNLAAARVLRLISYMQTACSEFPNDNPGLHQGAIWLGAKIAPASCELPPRIEHAALAPLHEPHEDAIDEESEPIEIVDDLAFADGDFGPSDDEPCETEAAVDPFARLAGVLTDVARTFGADAKAAAQLDVVLGLEASDALVPAQTLAWRGILRGESEDFGACGTTTLDEWAADVVARALGSVSRANDIRRELRRRGVAAFGLVADAA